MNLTTFKKGSVLLTLLFLLAVATVSDAVAQNLPNPVLVFAGAEEFKANGKQMIRYKYEVFNSETYPNTLFAASPELPPCGKNTKAARTWVDVYEQSGKRLNGFCAFGSNGDLRKIWFALEPDALAPSWIYIEMNDRKTNTKYKSNLAETTM
ncbi:MAG TPA: hypothetical protein VF791_15335 [Pyrinomonadaceae bacterium]